MLGMTNDQIMGLVRQLLPVLGGIAIALGWFTTDQWAGITATILQILGPLLTIGGVIWTVIANSKASILLSASQMPEVSKIVLNSNEPAAAALNQSTPNNVTMAPGAPAA